MSERRTPEQPAHEGRAPEDPTPADPTPAEMADADGVERPDAGDRRGLRALSAEDFSFAETIGGVRGLVESVAPGALFVVVFVITRELTPPLVAASVVALAAVVLRLVQRTPVTQALGGIFGVVIGVWWALRTGEPGRPACVRRRSAPARGPRTRSTAGTRSSASRHAGRGRR